MDLLQGKVVCLSAARERLRPDLATGQVADWERLVDETLTPLVTHADLAELVAAAPERTHPLVRYLMGMAAAIPPEGIDIETLRGADPPAAEIRGKLGPESDPWLHGYADGVEFRAWVAQAQPEPQPEPEPPTL